MTKRRCCGTCLHHEPKEGDPEDECWICTNPYSENYTEYTEPRDGCEQWEER